MASESAYACGGNKYVFVEKHCRIYVRRCGYMGRDSVAIVDDEEAFEAIRKDAGAYRIEGR
jgi:hypothetical protein